MAYLPHLNSRKPIADINVVPFIDVMLVLLVIFMITTPLLTQGVKVNLPKTKATAMTDQPKEPLIITVDDKGLFYFNLAEKPHQPITARALNHLVKLQLSKEANETRPVMVRGDKQVNYGKVIEAMVLLQQAGAKQVSLITEPLPEQSLVNGKS